MVTARGRKMKSSLEYYSNGKHRISDKRYDGKHLIKSPVVGIWRRETVGDHVTIRMIGLTLLLLNIAVVIKIRHRVSHKYSETCSCDHLYSETTSIQRPLNWSCPNCGFTMHFNLRDNKDHFILAQVRSLHCIMIIIIA